MKIKILPFLPELVKHLFRKPATVKYPFEKLPVPEGFRGTPFLHPEKCIVCRICVMDCPAEAIEEGEPYVINEEKCTECGNCAEVCPVEAIIEK